MQQGGTSAAALETSEQNQRAISDVRNAGVHLAVVHHDKRLPKELAGTSLSRFLSLSFSAQSLPADMIMVLF